MLVGREMTHALRVLWLPALVVLMLHGSADASLDMLASNAIATLRNNMGPEGEMLHDLFEVDHNNRLVAKSREKRASLLELPKGLVFELKWQLDIPYTSFTRFRTNVQLAFASGFKYGAEFLQDTDAPLTHELIPDKYKDKYQKEKEMYDQNQYLHRKKREASRTEREMMYSFIEKMMEREGLPGHICLLRTICEVAEAPFDEDLLGKLMNTVFRPSKGSKESLGDAYERYLLAEKHGLTRGSCHKLYQECEHSVFSKLPFLKHRYYSK